MKRYNFNRVGIFNILAIFDIQFTHFGSLFVEAWLTDELANKILAKFPGSMHVMENP